METQMMRPIFLYLLVMGCSTSQIQRNQMDEYKQTIRSAHDVLPVAVEIETLYPVADHFITHFGFDTKPKQWNTEVFFGGRYELTMQVEVEIDYQTSKITKVLGEPKFYLTEIKEIEILPDGRVSVSYQGQNQRQFGVSEWKEIYKNNGDLSHIGIKMNPTNVQNYDYYVSRIRQRRVPVSLLGEN